MQLAQRYRSRWVWPELGSWDVRKILCRPQREESGEEMERKEFEFSCQVHVTSHRRHLFKAVSTQARDLGRFTSFLPRVSVLGEILV